MTSQDILVVETDIARTKSRLSKLKSLPKSEDIRIEIKREEHAVNIMRGWLKGK